MDLTYVNTTTNRASNSPQFSVLRPLARTVDCTSFLILYWAIVSLTSTIVECSPIKRPEPPAPRLADEDVAAVAVGEAAEAVVAAGALVLAKAGRRAVGVRVSALERGQRRGPCARERRVPPDTILDVLADNVTGRLRDGRLLPVAPQN